MVYDSKKRKYNSFKRITNDRLDRRVDLINLETCDEFEFETDHKIKKEGAVTIRI